MGICLGQRARGLVLFNRGVVRAEWRPKHSELEPKLREMETLRPSSVFNFRVTDQTLIPYFCDGSAG
jgi:hypothetical protein